MRASQANLLPGCSETRLPIIVWNLNSNETWFSARIFPRLESTECWDFRHNCAHTSWLPRRRSWPAGHLQKWEISGKMRDELWRPLGKVARLVNFYCKAGPSAAEPKSPKTPKNNARKHSYVQCNMLLIYLYRQVNTYIFALSRERNWPWSKNRLRLLLLLRRRRLSRALERWTQAANHQQYKACQLTPGSYN